MIVETILVVACAAACSLLYYVATKNKRERIDFHGKHVVITGGNSGIGWDLCIDSFKQGAHVSIVARNQDRLNAIKKELESIKEKNPVFKSQIIQIESLDISKSCEETQKAFDRLVENAGPVDILINNAGIFKALEFTNTPAKDFEDMIRVNYLGSVYCTKAVVESMKQRRFGRIAFVSSQAGQIGIFGYTAYSATKFALRGLAEALQMELKPYNVYVTLAYPPDTNTPGLELENLYKPEETKIIAEGSGLASPKDVSTEIMKSVKKGSFSCSFGINGFLLTTLTSGAGNITTFKEGLIQITMLPLCRLIAIGLVHYFDSIVKSCFKKKQNLATK